MTMKRWWSGAALAILGAAGPAFAQGTYPGMFGAPNPIAQGPHPGMFGAPNPMYQQAAFANDPGPVTGPQFCAQPGPPPDLPFSLPNDGSPNAFSADDAGCHPNDACYLYVGWMALQRDTLGNGIVAVQDTASQRIDTGIGPAANAPPILRFGDLPIDYAHGVRATVGIREDCHAFELSGFYIGRQESSFTVADRGQLALPFAAFPSPLGFQGDNFLWLQADQVRLSLETALSSGEANYRYAHCPGLELLAGVRYLGVDERVSILTDDDGLTVSPVNQTQIADYSVRAHSRIVAMQAGFEYEHPIISHVTVGFSGKGAWGVNFMDINTVLRRGDGFFGPSARNTSTVFSHVYETSLWGTVLITEQCRIRAGYQCLWAVNVPEAVGQINFDPTRPNVILNPHGSIFYHGPMVELQFKF
jgi:hypothetical protein